MYVIDCVVLRCVCIIYLFDISTKAETMFLVCISQQHLAFDIVTHKHCMPCQMSFIFNGKLIRAICRSVYFAMCPPCVQTSHMSNAIKKREKARIYHFDTPHQHILVHWCCYHEIFFQNTNFFHNPCTKKK